MSIIRFRSTAVLAIVAVLGGAVVEPAPSPAAAPRCAAARSAVLHATPGTRTKTVSLTIDDGPSAWTGQYLDVLRRYRVHATFFMIGENVAAQPAMTRRVAEEGHTLANHSWDHPDMTRLSARRQAAQMDSTSAAIKKASGQAPCFFRGPGGSTDATTLRLARARRMTVTHWQYSTEDWRSGNQVSTSFQATIVAKGTGHAAHPIVLMHDGGPMNFRANSVAALGALIRYYQNRGYAFTDPAGTVLSTSFPAATEAVPVISTRPTDFTPTRGQRLTLFGLAYAVPAGSALTAQQFRAGRWHDTGAHTTVRADHTFSVAVVATVKGSDRFRVNAAVQAGNVVTVTTR